MQYGNRDAMRNNVILMFLYSLAAPPSKKLEKMGITPNQITTASLLFTIAAFWALILHEGAWLYMFLWGVAFFADFCDGTVARMTNNVRSTAFRYDHLSDVFKISLLILGTGIRYDTTGIWIASNVSIFCFLFLTLSNHDTRFIKHLSFNMIENFTTHKKLNTKTTKNFKQKNVHVNNNFKIKKSIKKTFNIFTKINGHTLIIFFLCPYGLFFAYTVLTYIVIISLYNSYYNLIAQHKYLRYK